MNYDDYTDWLTEQIVATAEVLGHDIKATAAGMMAEDLSAYPPDVMKKAMRRVRAEHTGRLSLKAILDRVDEAVGRPAANEAWAMALEALDEAKTVVWTEEMAQAWSAARPIANAGDMIGGRMAFIAAYERLVRDAREAGAMPVVTVSEGWDKEHRVAAVEKAMKLGYLPKAQAEGHLLEMRAVIAPSAAPVAGLLANNTADVTDVAFHMKRFDELRAESSTASETRDARRAEKAQAERAELQLKKDAIARRVAEYVQQGVA